MKNLKTLLVLSVFYLADCNREKLVDFVGDVVKTWNKKHSNTNDVVIFNFGSNNDLLNDLVKKISGENAIIFPQKQKKSKIGKPSFIIIISDIFDPNKLLSKLTWAIGETFWSSNSKLLFIPSKKLRVTKKQLQEVFLFFFTFKFLNAVFINDDGGIKIIMYDFVTRITFHYNENADVDVLFPDRLQNMKGYQFKAFAIPQAPRIFFDNKTMEWNGPDKLFMDFATKFLNATFLIQSLDHFAKNSVALYEDLMFTSSVHMNLNTINSGTTTHVNAYFKAVNSFDTTGYCALIPTPSRLSYLKYLLTPFDAYIWIYFLASVTIFAAVWRIFKKRSTSRDFDSAAHFVFGMIALFFLQALPFRRNRPILTFVTQFFVFTMMILGNAYQSLLISLISEPHFESKITTIDEMIERYQNYEVDDVFRSMVKESNSYPSMKFTRYSYKDLIRDKKVEERAKDGILYILKCDVANYVMSLPDSTAMRRLYYILPQKFYSMYEQYLTSRFSPFNEKLNEISLNVFETGIRQHWETLSTKAVQVSDGEEDNMLKLGDLVGVFYIYGFCLLIATIVFFMELLLFRWSERGAPFMLVRIGRFLGVTKRRRNNPEMNIGRVILEPISLDDLDELDDD